MARLLRTLAMGALLAALTGSGLSACAGGGNAQGVVDKFAVASGKVTNFRTETASKITMQTVGGSTTNSLDMSLTGNGEVDVAHDRSHQALHISRTASGQNPDTFDIELYAADQWQYLKFPMGEGGPTWIKIARAGDVLTKSSQVAQETELLRTATNLETLPSETVDGVACNVLQAKPDIQKLLALILGQSQTHYTMGLQASDFADFDLTKIVKSARIKEWIAKDTNRLVKAEGSTSIQLSPADVGANSTDFTSLDIDMTISIKFSAYNGQIDIQVPTEALGAPEMSTSATPPPSTSVPPSSTPVPSK